MFSMDDISLRRKLRILILVRAGEKALLGPVNIGFLHTMAYMTNVLAPVWEMPVYDGKLLKKETGPFYPNIQADSDSLVGQGLLIQSNLEYVLNSEEQWRLQGSYMLNDLLAAPVLTELTAYSEEQQLISFCEEVAYGLSILANVDGGTIGAEDATYGDPEVDFGSVIDFAEWTRHNQAREAAQELGRFLPSGTNTTAGEKIHSYVRHLSRRLNGTG